MRIAIAGLMHESNTFSRTRTDRAAFRAASVTRGEELVAEWRDAHHELGGFIEGAARFHYEIDPIVMLWATPSGPVTDDVIDETVDEIVRHLCDRVGAGRPDCIDGLLLALHGAMVGEGYRDGDGEVLRRLRAAFGPDFPIVVTLDFHANVSQAMVDYSTAIVAYQTNPHVDQRARGVVAASIMARTVRSEIRPAQALAKPDTLIVIACQNTSLDPLKPLMLAAHELEREPGVLAASLLAGFPYADVHEIGPSVIVVTDGDRDRAAREADRLANVVWASRERLVRSLADPKSAVAEAMRSAKPPVVLVDFGDNVGGGSPADGTVLLAELLDQRVEGGLVALCDPEAVRLATAAGVGSTIELSVGGKTDAIHGSPVRVRGRVRSLHDGRWTEDQARHGGRRHNDQGATVVLDGVIHQSQAASGSSATLTLVLNSKRTPPFSLGQITSLGIDPAAQRMIVVKAAIAYRAAYGPIAGSIIEVDTPGLTANDPRHFDYRSARRPLYPLDALPQ